MRGDVFDSPAASHRRARPVGLAQTAEERDKLALEREEKLCGFNPSHPANANTNLMKRRALTPPTQQTSVLVGLPAYRLPLALAGGARRVNGKALAEATFG